jgi:hypothetical protein
LVVDDCELCRRRIQSSLFLIRRKNGALATGSRAEFTSGDATTTARVYFKVNVRKLSPS